VTKQEEREVRSCLLDESDDLMVELFNRESIDTMSASVAKSFIVNKMDTESIERELETCLKEYIMALCRSMS
jgi:hypothetical protein